MIEELFHEIAEAGWMVNNLFQTSTGWQANLRRQASNGNWMTDFGRGDTPQIALEDAIAKLETAEFYEQREVSYSAAPSEKITVPLSIIDKLVEPIKRRI